MTMFRARAADDFATIRARLDELRAERERPKHWKTSRPTEHSSSERAGCSLAPARSRSLGNSDDGSERAGTANLMIAQGPTPHPPPGTPPVSPPDPSRPPPVTEPPAPIPIPRPERPPPIDDPPRPAAAIGDSAHV